MRIINILVTNKSLSKRNISKEKCVRLTFSSVIKHMIDILSEGKVRRGSLCHLINDLLKAETVLSTFDFLSSEKNASTNDKTE